MFFIISKTLGFFASPSNLLLCLGFAGLLLGLTRWRRIGRGLTAASLVLLVVAGLSPLGNWLIAPLEERFPAWDAGRGAPDGIVVLGGAISSELSLARGAPYLNESAERITAAAALARTYPQARIIYSGGTNRVILPNGAEADIAASLFESIGLPRERLILDGRSRNTVENAEFSRTLAAPKPGERWLLVTSAYHMPRAMAVFRAAQFPVEAYPVDWRTAAGDGLFPFDTVSAGLRRTDTAVREWAGLVVYWLTGRTQMLFPGP
ncbi:YdcF family protein [Xanthobacteraceae bacterium Astr-EGSB]|uniref:YdcF family protein n=1 Tax=Astrobacterium formosum TaxID=3069710 RepID=UPI0027B5B597|nr:YdcF family protein [Xanthobacteraceae bacterium Astr-EGSB]